ncbi:DUF5367 family protein [Salinirubrum litoreum]|uniref:DUF5367 family protein n=1 Tax=Salinirubrum litoreum TaxID=1126234 RepID=A0ABD5R9M6_9EURY|nr:DUF5367 family protein [Salinirubrum litoreum]
MQSTDTSTSTTTASAPNPTADSLYLGVGFAVWLVATVAVRLVGARVFDPAAPVLIAGVFVVTIPAMIALTLLIFRWRETPTPARPRAAGLLVAPGLLLDAFVLPLHATVFPQMPLGGVPFFGGFLLLAYGVVIVTGLQSGRGR